MNKKDNLLTFILSHLNNFFVSYALPGVRLRHNSKLGVSTFIFSQDVSLKIFNVERLSCNNILEELEFRKEKKLLLVAPYFPPATAKRLSSALINYADTAGNLHLRINDNIFHVKNCPRPAALTRSVTPGRCWNPQGMKVLFLLLTEELALNWTYRKIAEQSAVSLGTVHNLIDEALTKKYLLRWDKGFRWTNKQKMIDLWCINYAEILLPRLETVFYRGSSNFFGKSPFLLPAGETAAAIAGMMQTTVKQFWSQGNIAQIVAKKRWRADKEGNIKISKAFWPEMRRFTKAVPWLLIYADLMTVDDNRCHEVAEIIKQKFLSDSNDVTC